MKYLMYGSGRSRSASSAGDLVSVVLKRFSQVCVCFGSKVGKPVDEDGKASGVYVSVTNEACEC